MSNQPESSNSKGTKKDFSMVKDDNSIVDPTEKLQNKELDDASFKANDTNKLDSESMNSVALFDVGTVVLMYDGRHRGRVGCIKKREKDRIGVIQVEDPNGRIFVTHINYALPRSKDGKPWVLDKPWEADIREAAEERYAEIQAKEKRRRRREQWRQKKEDDAKEERKQKKETGQATT